MTTKSEVILEDNLVRQLAIFEKTKSILRRIFVKFFKLNRMKPIIDIIKSIDGNQPNVNPTEIYNEGWMTRLLVYHSIQEKLTLHGIDFGKIKNWTSEALISSPFIHAKVNREGYTHADMALGDFKVDYEKEGKIHIPDTAKKFGIIEAKMGSNLSPGTTHAENYNQASRNLACIAQNTYNKKCETFFIVVAPYKKLKDHDIDGQINKWEEEIKARFAQYDIGDEIRKNENKIIAKIKNMTICSMSYEDWIKAFQDNECQNALWDFYKKCDKWNKLHLFEK